MSKIDKYLSHIQKSGEVPKDFKQDYIRDIIDNKSKPKYHKFGRVKMKILSRVLYSFIGIAVVGIVSILIVANNDYHRRKELYLKLKQELPTGTQLLLSEDKSDDDEHPTERPVHNEEADVELDSIYFAKEYEEALVADSEIEALKKISELKLKYAPDEPEGLNPHIKRDSCLELLWEIDTVGLTGRDIDIDDIQIDYKNWSVIAWVVYKSYHDKCDSNYPYEDYRLSYCFKQPDYIYFSKVFENEIREYIDINYIKSQAYTEINKFLESVEKAEKQVLEKSGSYDLMWHTRLYMVMQKALVVNSTDMLANNMISIDMDRENVGSLGINITDSTITIPSDCYLFPGTEYVHFVVYEKLERMGYNLNVKEPQLVECDRFYKVFSYPDTENKGWQQINTIAEGVDNYEDFNSKITHERFEKNNVKWVVVEGQLYTENHNLKLNQARKIQNVSNGCFIRPAIYQSENPICKRIAKLTQLLNEAEGDIFTKVRKIGKFRSLGDPYIDSLKEVKKILWYERDNLETRLEYSNILYVNIPLPQIHTSNGRTSTVSSRYLITSDLLDVLPTEHKENVIKKMNDRSKVFDPTGTQLLKKHPQIFSSEIRGNDILLRLDEKQLINIDILSEKGELRETIQEWKLMDKGEYRISYNSPNTNVYVSIRNDKGENVILEMISQNEKVSIFPNPAERRIKVQITGSPRCKIYDISGKKVLEFSGNEADVSELPRGRYSVEIDLNGEIKIGEFIKK